MMAGEVSDVMSTEKVVTDTVTMPDSEDLLSIEADVAMLSATVSEATNEQCDESLNQSDGVAKGVKLDAELTGGNHEVEEIYVSGEKIAESLSATKEALGQDVLINSNQSDGVAKGVKLDAELTRGNHEVEEIYVSGEKIAESLSATKEALGQDVLINSNQSDGVAKGVKLDAELTRGNHEVEEIYVSGEKIAESLLATEEALGQDVLINANQSDGVAKGVKLDAELTRGNHEVEEIYVSGEKIAESLLATEEALGQDVLIKVDTGSEPATGIVTEADAAEVAVTDNHESLDHYVTDGSLGSSLRACFRVDKQSSSDLSGHKVADVADTPSQVEAVVVTGDAVTEETASLSKPNVVTEETASLSKPNVQEGGDATPAYEMGKETPVEGTKQDGDRSTAGDECVSSAPCTETSVKETQLSVVKLSGSSPNSTEANDLGIDKEKRHLQDPQVPGISKSFSFDLPNTSDGDTNNVSKPSTTSQDLAASGTVVGSPVAFISTPKNKKRSTKVSEGTKESPDPKRKRSTVRKGRKKADQPDEATIVKQVETEERPATALTAVGSSFPTLNFSTMLPAAFQQPFSDLQQLQLRAQIFVYGSLIQGNAPDEACLISAFGGPDGGRSIWEKPWRKCVARIHNQISQNNMKSPALQSSGKSKLDQTNKRKRNAPLIGSAGKSDSPQTVNPSIPLSSPFWSMHTSPFDSSQVSEIPQVPLVDRTLPPLYPFQSPVKNTVHVSPWSAHASRPLPLVSFAQTSLCDTNMMLSAYPSAEPVKLTPVKESSLIPYSTANHSSPNMSVSSIAPPAISSEILGDIKVFNSLGQIAKEPKAKKPKKVSVSSNASLLLEPTSHSSEPGLVDPSSSIQNASPSPHPAAVVLTSSTTSLRSSDQDAGKKDFTSEDALHRVKEAKLHAEEAAACAEAAVTHSQHVWDQMDKQKNSGIIADVECKVASAAAAIAAAVSVAKAAAAAARLASEAALQAKLMADKSLVSSECIKVGSVNRVTDGLNLLDEVTPASILKGENCANISTSIIGAAKEAARRKIESALSASMHAKNLDAIVKAAELAAEAVAQAGRVVAMGDPPLVHSGPEGYCKLSQQPPEQIALSNFPKEVFSNNEANGGNLSFTEISQDGSLNPQPSDHTKPENQPAPDMVSLKIIDAQMTMEDHVSVPVAVEDSNATAEVLAEVVCDKKSPLTLCQESENIAEASIDNHIKEGSVVEVFKEWGSVKAGWFAAKVLELKDDEICVSYLETQIGDGEYKEWISLSCEDITAPIVRIAHPVTVVPSDGPRKRRRSAIGRRSWEVGDKVDAWMQDCWWEGLIIEKNSRDALSLTVQFPAQGETCVVKAWNLRPSLIWKDGAWVQWSNPNESVHRPEDATPRGKRPRLNSPHIDVRGKDKASECYEQSSLMGLSEKNKKFNIGKSTTDVGKDNAQRMVRTGLREGSKIIFGVPKPGKKRKFMDVGNSNEARKTSRIPISRGPHGWKNTIPRTEAQQKTSRSKPKVPSVSSAPSEVDEGRELDHTADNGGTSGPERQAEPESCSVADEGTDDSILISSLARPPSNPLSKRSGLGNLKSERANRGKLEAPRVDKVDSRGNKVFSGTKQQEISDGTETRRSNRRIQPTSRLLEGLQTSISITKVPSTVNRK